VQDVFDVDVVRVALCLRSGKWKIGSKNVTIRSLNNVEGEKRVGTVNHEVRRVSGSLLDRDSLSPKD
jgi:hypothetical protein